MITPLSQLLFGVGLGSDSSRVRLDPPAALDAYRRGDELIVHVDVPGVALDAVEVDFEDGWLSIQAERAYAPDPQDRVLIAERPFGRFQRRVRLAESLDVGRASAVLEAGVLTLRIPVMAKATSSKIAVSAGGAQASLAPADESTSSDAQSAS